MDSKYCSRCHSKKLLSNFLKTITADPQSRVFSTCITCREKMKRRALQPAHPNRQPKRQVLRPPYEQPRRSEPRSPPRPPVLRTSPPVSGVVDTSSPGRNHFYSPNLTSNHVYRSKDLGYSLPSPLRVLQSLFSPKLVRSLHPPAFSRPSNGGIFRAFTRPWTRSRWRPTAAVRKDGLR